MGDSTQVRLAGIEGNARTVVTGNVSADWCAFEHAGYAPPMSQADLPPAKPDVSAVVDNFVNSDAERYRAALQEIATTDLKRCSAGWLRDIALRALGET